MSDETDPVRRHLDAAETWLANAEGYRAKIAELEPETAPSADYAFRVNSVRDQSGALLSSAIQIAELHRAMGQTYWEVTPQRLGVDPTVDVEAMVERLGEQLKADAEEFDAQTLRPGADPEPEAEGELWIAGDGWFYYAVTGPVPARGELERPRWLLVRHYAQVLRWNSEQGAKPMPLTWAEVGESLTNGDVCGTLRRPTIEERAAFYGPEPDPQPAIEETHERTTTIPTATLGEAFRTPYGAAAESPEGPVRFDATVQAFSDDAVEEMYQAVKRERTRRAYTAPEDRGMFRDRG